MEKNVSLGWSAASEFQSALLGMAVWPLCKLERYYSEVLGRRVGIAATAHLLHVQAAFLAMLLLSGAGLCPALAGVVWFGWSVRLCSAALAGGRGGEIGSVRPTSTGLFQV